MGFFTKARRGGSDMAGLGASLVALRLAGGAAEARPAPAGSVIVIVDGGGRARRSLSAKAALDAGDTVYCFHPGPYSADLVPFAAAPELGLRLQFVVDAADPRVTQQRFDLFLSSEAGARLTLEQFAGMLQTALQLELAQGNLELPPCTSVDEWNLFRAGLNQLLYTRFGITVEDCLPADLGERVDFAATLAARAQAPTPVLVPPPPSLEAALLPGAPMQNGEDGGDARALRRLFLELPAAAAALRLIALPAGQALFQAHRGLLQRLDLASLAAATMPSLAWAAPDRRAGARQQARRAAASAAAARALDEAWALLARLQLAAIAQLPALLDEADRILSNLELGLESRRAAFLAPAPDEPNEPNERHERREPT